MLHSDTVTQSVLRPTHVQIDLGVITYNFNEIVAKAHPAKTMFVLKANAYGHGLVKIAQHLEKLGVDYLGVAYLEEGLMLRDAGIRSPILVLGGIIGNQIPLFIKNDLTLTASSVDKLKQIDRVALRMGTPARVHLKIDTGMERIGIHYYSADQLIQASLQTSNVMVEGIFTHLANADNRDLSYTQLQLKRFEEVLSYYKHMRSKPQIIHVSNSSGLLQVPEANFNMVRVGILLYGVYPSPHLSDFINVRPAMSWKSHIVYFKVVKPDHPVSYGSSWQTFENTRVVTIPVGYGDGYMRALSNRAFVLIGGQRYPVIGKICMDQTMVNIGKGSAYNGDEVLLMGKQDDQEIRVEDLAEWAHTVPYEILTNINTRVPRVYINSYIS